MAQFDPQAAAQAGYSPAEIAKIQQGISAARAAGYSDDEIAQHLGTMPASPPPPVFSPAARIPLGIASSVLQGAETAIGIPGEIDALGNSLLPSWMTSDLITGAPASSFGPGGTVFPRSQEIINSSNSLGLTNNPALAAQSTPEKYAQAGAEGLGGAIPFGGLGDLAIGAQGIAGGLGGELGHEMVPDSHLLPLVTGLGAGLATGGAIHEVQGALESNAASKALQEAENQLSLARQAWDNFFLTKQGDKSSLRDSLNDQFTQAKNLSEQTRQQAMGTFGTQIETIASGLGPARTIQEAGENLQNAGRDWLTSEMPKRQAAAWQPVDAAIPPGTPLELPNFAQALHQINTSAGALEPLNALLKPDLPRQLEGALKSALQPREAIPGEGTAISPTIAWDDVRRVRSALGDARGNPALVKDIGEQNLNHLYAALTADMRTAAGNVGPDALKAFDLANKTSEGLYQFAEGPLAKVISSAKAGDETLAPEAVAKRLMTSGKIGATDLAALRQEMPHAVDNLTAAILRQPKDPWTQLAPEAQQVLGQAHASLINSTLASRDQAIQLANQTLAKAKEIMSGGLKAGDETYSTQATNLRRAKLEAQANKNQAEQRYNALDPAKEIAQRNALFGLLGTDVGHYGSNLARMGMNALGLPGGDIMENVGPILGAMAPFAYRGAKAVLLNPNRLRGPLAAGVAASNPMNPPIPYSKP